MFKQKIVAAIIHGVISVFVAAMAAFMVFVVWFPGELSEILKGAGLFLLLLGVEVVLGPVMSLVIYNSSKPRRELIADYCIVGVIQLVALIYGVNVVAHSRPVYLVYVKDRIEAVSALELDPSDLEDAGGEFQGLGWFGPKLVCVSFPASLEAKSELVVLGLSGKDIQLLPKYYRNCKNGELLDGGNSMEQFQQLEGYKDGLITPEVSSGDYRWLPIVSRFAAWVVVYNGHELNDFAYINIDPFKYLQTAENLQSGSD